jgi:hypothetical protein
MWYWIPASPGFRQLPRQGDAHAVAVTSSDNWSNTPNALGAPDNLWARANSSGVIVLDLGAGNAPVVGTEIQFRIIRDNNGDARSARIDANTTNAGWPTTRAKTVATINRTTASDFSIVTLVADVPGLRYIRIDQAQDRFAIESITYQKAICVEDDFILVNADVNVGYVNKTLTGNVNTNDFTETGHTYNTPTLNVFPSGSSSTLSLSPNGSYTFTADTPGIYQYTVPSAPLGGFLPYSSLLTITVLDPNVGTNPPVANTDLAVTFLNTSVSIDVLENDRAGNFANALVPSSLSIPAIADPGYPANGTISIVGNEIVYTPNTGYVGSDSFTYTICDNSTPTPLCTTATVFVEVYPAASPNRIIGSDDYYFTSTASTITGFNVLDNDSQLSVGALTVTNPGTYTITGGALTLNADGTFTFIPNPDFQGTTSFIYSLEGAGGTSTSATMYITIGLEITAYPDFGVAFVDEVINGNVSTNDVYPDGTVYNGLTEGSIPSGATYLLSFNPDGSYSFSGDTPGVYVFEYDICPPIGVCEDGILTITVTNPAVTNNPPVANPDLALTYQNTLVQIRVLDNDKPGNAAGTLNPASITFNGPLAGSLTLAAGVFSYTPTLNFVGVDTFTYTVCNSAPDGTLCATTTVYVTVYATGTVNVVLAADDYYRGTSGSPIIGDVRLNDDQLVGLPEDLTVTNPGTYTITGGTLTLAANGTFSFIPSPSFNGNTSFVYHVSGAGGAEASATLYITVFSDVFADSDVNATIVNVPVTGDLSTNDEVPPGSTYTLLTADPDLVLNAHGTYTFTKTTAGIYTYNIRVCPPGTSITVPPCQVTQLRITVTESLCRWQRSYCQLRHSRDLRRCRPC